MGKGFQSWAIAVSEIKDSKCERMISIYLGGNVPVAYWGARLVSPGVSSFQQKNQYRIMGLSFFKGLAIFF